VRAYLKFGVVGLLSLMLSACGSGAEQWLSSRMPWTGVTEDAAVEKVAGDASSSVSAAPAAPAADRLSNVPGVVPVPPPTKPSEAELFSIAGQSSRNNVKIYGAEGQAAAPSDMDVAPPYNPYADGPGLPAAVDSRVTIYPMDDIPNNGGFYAGSYMGSGAYNGSATSIPEYSGAIEGQKTSEAGSGTIPARVYFEHGSSRLDGEDRQVLSQVAEQAKFAPVGRVSIEGHASSRVNAPDSVQARMINLKQSMNRAVAVSNNLIQNGVPPEKIKTTSWGDTKPPMNGSEAEARRVDIFTGGAY
jgi:outer membrane protein OmpA-like peptidoglycan-associated protein